MIRRGGYNQFRQLLRAHTLEIAREPGVLFWGIVFPILMSLGLGIAFTKKQDTVRKVAVIEGFRSATTDSILGHHTSFTRNTNSDSAFFKLSLENTQLGNTTYLFYPMQWDEAMVALKQGRINLIVDQVDGKTVFRFDPLNPDAQLIYLKLSQVFDGGEQRRLEYTENIKPLTVTGTRYIDFLIPGLLAMGIMMSTMWGLSYGIIEKRSKKLLRRMVATPMNKSYFLVSFMFVRMVINFLEALLLILFAWLTFHITIQGSIPALLLIFVAGNIGFAGLAFFISSRTAKTEIGNGLINVVVMPMMLLSGIFFSYHNFPEKLIPILRKLPLTMVADGMRSIFIEGAGMAQIAVSAIVLVSGGVVFLVLGLKYFRWY
jgi:ABC-2 type transport system permease protein